MPVMTEAESGRRLALVIATGSYSDPTLARLKAPGRDAADLASVLGDVDVGAFEVESAIDAPVQTLRRQVARFCGQGAPGDLLVVYLSCHGLLDDRGRLYYATVDTDRALLSATGLSAGWLNEQLEDCRCRRQILVLDCCHGGAFARGAKGESALALRERFEGRGRVVLTGSRATEYSFERSTVVGESVSSVFTSALVKGLRSGEADRDGDGMITVAELYDYTFEEVKAREPRQTPTLWAYGAEGELVLARSPRGARSERSPSSPAVALRDTSEAPSFGSRRTMLGVAGSAVAVVGVLVAALLLASGRGGGTPLPEQERIAVAGSPRGIAVGEGATWVSRYDSAQVSRIDPSARVETIDVGAHPGKLVAGRGSVWVSVGDGSRLVRIDPSTRKVTNRVRISGRGCECSVTELALAPNALLVGSAESGTITPMNLRTGSPLRKPYLVGAGFNGAFAVGAGVLWAIGGDDERPSVSWVMRIDRGSDAVKRIPLRKDSYLSGVAYGQGTLWMADAANTRNTVSALDPSSQTIYGQVKVATGIISDDIALDGNGVLVWDPNEGWLTRIDARELQIVRAQRIHGYRTNQAVNRDSSDLSVAGDRAWVTDPIGEAVYSVSD